jgi:hypothetical protein
MPLQFGLNGYASDFDLESPLSEPSHKTDCLDEGLHGFPQSVHANATLPSVRL